jgi:large subunit ribosomal protein L24
MHVKMGDLVEVISGSEKGKRGKVLRVDHKHNKVKVEGVRVVTKHIRKTQTQDGPQPGRIEKREAFFPSCKVMPVDPGSDKATRVYSRVVDGKKVRVGKSGAVIVAAPATEAQS